MHESAKLNTGNQPTATKSTTWPRRNPGDAEEAIAEVAQRTAEHEDEADQLHRSVALRASRTMSTEIDDRTDGEDAASCLGSG